MGPKRTGSGSGRWVWMGFLFIIALMLFAGGAFALSTRKSADFVDRDEDGEPDEPNGPAGGL